MAVKRIAQVIGVKPEDIQEYERIHADAWPSIINIIKKANKVHSDSKLQNKYITDEKLEEKLKSDYVDYWVNPDLVEFTSKQVSNLPEHISRKIRVFTIPGEVL